MSAIDLAKTVYARMLPEQTRAAFRRKRRYWRALAEHRRYCARTGDKFLAPPDLRFRVAGGYDIDHFVKNGKLCYEDLNRALLPLQRNVHSFHDVLDFGVGCGRMIRWFDGKPDTCRVYGTDIDADAIEWDRKTFPFAQFSVNQPLPALPYDEGRFDLIYSHSVFTHIDEDYQFRWLEELRRVTRPGAVLLLSVHGRHVGELKGFNAEMWRELKEKGILHVSMNDPRWQGIFPEFYQTTYHDKDYISRTWSKYFEVLDCLDHGIGNYQDLIVLRRR